MESSPLDPQAIPRNGDTLKADHGLVPRGDQNNCHLGTYEKKNDGRETNRTQMAVPPATSWSPGQGQACSLSGSGRTVSPWILHREALVTEHSALSRKAQHPRISPQRYLLKIPTFSNQKASVIPYRFMVQSHNSGYKVGLMGLAPVLLWPWGGYNFFICKVGIATFTP